MIRSSTLPSGIRLVTESMADVRSVCVGVFVGTGSRDETPEQSGISHFLEHLLFKGTETLSAREIAEAVDAVGGDMNAYTTKEYTAFYVRTLSEHLELPLEILGDILRKPAFRPNELEAERQVILEELLMHFDEPSEVVQERFAEAMFPGHPLGREVLGDRKKVKAVTIEEIRAFFEEHYRPLNMVIAAAGDIDHEVLEEAIARRFNEATGGPPKREAPGNAVTPLVVETRDSEQAHIVVGVRAPERRSSERFSVAALNHALGGGLSSRLFQEIRESRGLAYSIGSDRVAYEDSGMLQVSLGTAPEHVPEVIGLLDRELDALCSSGITERELEVAKGHLRADLLLSLEDSGARMSRIGASLLLHGQVLTVDDLLAKIDEVSMESVANVAKRMFSGERVLAAVGPFEEDEFPFG